jgi:hypothetical protein
MDDSRGLIEEYGTIGLIAGASPSLGHSLALGGNWVLALVIGGVVGALGGALFGYLKLRALARLRIPR